MKNYRGILFDLDGVLIDSKDVHFQAFSDALLSVTGLALSKEEHTLRFCGLPTIKKLRILQAETEISNTDLAKVFDLKQELTRELIEDKDFFRQDIYDLVSNLSKTGVKTAVCSNTTRPTLDIILESLGINRFLNLSLSSNDVLAPKPAPDIYIKAMAHLEIARAETLILEDSVPGLEAAKLSGAEFLMINSPEDVCGILNSFLKSSI